ncbi:MAG: polysaccharide pyruvyl transferase CsaB [Oscillospiraceae bacterium]|jgi:polysaccharide pyruvyl transferase CsaB|nr:polysaccharide pyruvyl transferase CsaB [Oscillospiraceae bacterium]
MKILHMISGGDVGGAKTHVLSLLEQLNKTETVHLVCFTRGDFLDEARLLDIPSTVLEEGNLFATRRRILAMIRHDGYQLIHCHGARANMMGAMLKKQAGIPIITTVHSDYRLDYMGRPAAALTFGNINKLALRRFDAWVGVSDVISQMLIARGFNPQRVFSVYNGVDFESIATPLPREEYLQNLGLQFDERSVVLGIAARISPIKDMTTLLRAFSKAQQQCPQLRLLIAGDGEQAQEIQALAQQICAENTVCFAGWVQDMPGFYNAIDVNLLTSLSEGFPYVLLEGAQMRCATISSRVGGVPLLITHGVQGLLFEPRDVDELAKHMVFMAENDEARRRMGQALFDKTKREFSTKTMLARQKSCYEATIRRANRPKKKRDGVLICGAYGRGNNGDEAILDAIIEQMRRIDPDMPLCATSRDPKNTRLQARIGAVYTLNILKIWRILRHSALYLSGGGTLMQDVTSTNSLLYYLFGVRLAKKCGAKVMLYGCGIGPISKPGNRKKTTKILNRYADLISLRDAQAQRELEALGVRKPEIHLTADPTLTISPREEDFTPSILARHGISADKRYLMLAVRPWDCFEEKLSAIAAAADYASSAYGLIPLLYPMESGRDLPATKALAEHLTCPHIVMPGLSGSRAVIALISKMSLLLSMRLHALVFAAGQGVPMVGVVYDPKVSGFMEYLGQKLYLDLRQVTSAALCKLIDRAMAEGSAGEENIRRLRTLAAQNEQLAAKLLEK